MPGERAESVQERAYLVVVNGEGQYAIWPAALAIPPGWRQRGHAMPRDACLSAVAAAWPDIAPASARCTGRAPGPRGPGAGSVTSRGHEPRHVHELFDEQARLHPDAVAVVSAAGALTYRQLSDSANRLAHYLRGRGVRPETVAGVCLERGSDAVRCLLATLKAGGAYLPLDPTLPGARLAQMCEEAGAGFVLLRRRDAGAFRKSRVRLVFADELAPRMAPQPVTAPAVSLRADNIAYAIYTSGSTGRPKAVAVSHGSLACLCHDVIGEYELGPGDRVLQLAAMGFDTSLEQMLATLLSGAALLLPGAGTLAPTDLISYVAEQQVTVLDLTPAYWHQVLAGTQAPGEQLGSVRLMITGGDRAQAGDCRTLVRARGGARLLNAYGLTETTITSAVCEVDERLLPPRRGAPVPVGKPLTHAQVLVLDEDLNPVPTGVAGEIYIGGGGVARGYLGRPGMTAERFMPNPHGAEPGTRMYRTGDLGRWRPDHNLEVIGRVDRQVKIRGFRVEPAEIESALARHPDIDEVAVVTRAASGGGDRQIWAYYTHRHRGWARDLPSEDGLRSFLSSCLPSFMIPAVFAALGRMPRTPDGGVDYRALSPPAGAAPEVEGGAGAGTYTPAQAAMSELWSQVLGIGQVRPEDDFFKLGGNSLLAAEMLARARVMFGLDAEQIRPLTRCLLRNPTLRGFVDATRDARAGVLAPDGPGPRVDFAKEAELDVVIRTDAGPPPDWRQPAEILLTGATGFFGAHLLREFLATTGARVHCLVRADDDRHARRRIAAAAGRFGLGDLPLDRVVAVTGDLGEPDLGLPEGRFDELARTIDVIHHVGALVNFIYPYRSLRAPNVGGTRELIRLAGLYRGIPIHYISTIAVLAGFGAVGVRAVREETPLAHADRLSVGYIETKFVAEELLRNAARNGLPVTVYRPLDIVGDQHSGTWNTATEMCALIRFITDTGRAPDIDLPLDFVPADICAAAVRYISSHVVAAGNTYHLSSPEHALLGSLTGRLRAYGFTIEEVPYHEWIRDLLRYAAGHTGHPMTPFVPLFVDRIAGAETTVAEMYLEHTFPSYDRANTERALRGSGIGFPAVGAGLLDLHIARLVATGFLKRPPAGDRETAHPRAPEPGSRVAADGS